MEISRNDASNTYAAARMLAKRILPDGKAVAQLSRLIRFYKPLVEDSEAMVDNVNRDHAPVGGAETFTDPFGRGLALNAIGREKIEIELPPQITEKMLPKKRDTDETDENIKGLAELVADLGIAYVLDTEAE